MDNLRICTVTIKKKFGDGIKIEKHNAYFHGWHDKFWTVPAFMIGDVGGQMSQTYGIVEYEDGSIHEHLPEEMRFMDRKRECEDIESQIQMWRFNQDLLNILFS